MTMNKCPKKGIITYYSDFYNNSLSYTECTFFKKVVRDCKDLRKKRMDIER